jgi:hypothetical protein
VVATPSFQLIIKLLYLVLRLGQRPIALTPEEKSGVCYIGLGHSKVYFVACL